MYQAIITAKTGLLIGGVKQVKSSSFATKQEAQNWLAAMSDSYRNKDNLTLDLVSLSEDI
jgi:hypothetical protein